MLVCGLPIWDDTATVKGNQARVMIPLHCCCFLYYTHELLALLCSACGWQIVVSCILLAEICWMSVEFYEFKLHAMF